MRILTVNTLYSPYILGGAEITVKSIVEGLSSRGHKVSVLTTAGNANPGVLCEYVDQTKVYRVGIPNTYWHYDRKPRNGLQRLSWHLKDRLNHSMSPYIQQVIDDVKPDLIFTHNLVGISVVVWQIAKALDIPVIHVMHDPYLICPRSNMFHQDRACVKQCLPCRLLRLQHPGLSNAVSAVIGVSQFILDLHLRHGYFKSVPVRRVIHNARSLRQIDSVSRLPRSDRPLRFGFIGTLAVSKGIFSVLDAFEKLNKDLPDSCELIIAGKGDKDNEDLVQVKMKTLPGKYLGYTEPHLFFEDIDVLVVPSIWNDTLPGVVFESLGFGVPVLGTRRGGIPEMIEHEKNGWLYEPENEGELLRFMKNIFLDRQVLDVMSIQARTSAVPFMKIDRMIDEYEKLALEIAR